SISTKINQLLLPQSTTNQSHKNKKTRHTLKPKMNENLFASFITPTLIGLPIVVLIIAFPSILFPTTSRLVSNRLVAIQQ
ncbi:hypothetical protein, partial [Klebsiella pneumoniae]|uniref:hypothetical protein n=1 Tax=Klebsiella pneumoniae TaxID=573 RepID=UPI001D0F28AF